MPEYMIVPVPSDAVVSALKAHQPVGEYRDHNPLMDDQVDGWVRKVLFLVKQGVRPSEASLAVLQERATQISRGYTAEHDMAHSDPQALITAAQCYVATAWGEEPEEVRVSWPWNEDTFHPRNAKRDLEKAAALLLAHLDLLNEQSGEAAVLRALGTADETVDQRYWAHVLDVLHQEGFAVVPTNGEAQS